MTCVKISRFVLWWRRCR